MAGKRSAETGDGGKDMGGEATGIPVRFAKGEDNLNV